MLFKKCSSKKIWNIKEKEKTLIHFSVNLSTFVFLFPGYVSRVEVSYIEENRGDVIGDTNYWILIRHMTATVMDISLIISHNSYNVTNQHLYNLHRMKRHNNTLWYFELHWFQSIIRIYAKTNKVLHYAEPSHGCCSLPVYKIEVKNNRYMTVDMQKCHFLVL